MYYLLDKQYDETFTINFIGTEQFGPGDTLVLTMPECVDGITEITSYTGTTVGETDSVYLTTYFQYKQGDETLWSEPLPIDEITTFVICPTKCLQLKLLYYRMDDGGANSGVTITLTNPSIGGIFEFTSSDETLTLTTGDTIQILDVPDVFKIFSIDGFEVISTARYGNAFTIKYRFSQDEKLSWTKWEPLTQENISTVHWDKTRFVWLQYMFEFAEGYGTPVKIYDVILYGDFQNVTTNSLKLNLFGLKQNCISLYYPSGEISEETGGINPNLTTSGKDAIDSTTQSLLTENSEYQLRMNWMTQGLRCYSNPDMGGISPVDQMKLENNQNSAALWNPYDYGKIVDWHEFLAGTINDMLGFTIDYHRTDPDKNGIDHVIHEHQLHNIVDMKTIKVLVPDN